MNINKIFNINYDALDSRGKHNLHKDPLQKQCVPSAGPIAAINSAAFFPNLW